MDQIKTALATELTRTSRLKIGEIKELLGIPRNAIIPLMESLDNGGFTRRDGDYRTLANADYQ
jgi:DNA-binding IclR family transcriptional regulator